MTKKELLPLYVRNTLPSLDATADTPLEESVVRVKFFYPDLDWTWYGIAWDGDDLFFGLVDGFEAELGYFRLSELLANRGKLGLEIERDRHFPVQPLLPIYRAAQARQGEDESPRGSDRAAAPGG